MLYIIVIVFYSVLSNKFFIIQWLNQIKKVFIKRNFFKKKQQTNFLHLDLNKTTDLEDTVRNLREENAKLLQLLRSRK